VHAGSRAIFAHPIADNGLGPKAQSIVDAMLSAICTHRLAPGTKIGEAQVAQFFSTSRTIVRQALQHLAFLGMVRLEANRGAFVATASLKEAGDLYSARKLIEAETVAALVRDCTANDIRFLRAHIDREREAEEMGDRWMLIRLRSEFHLMIAKLSGNDVLHDLLAHILPRTAMIAAFYRDCCATCSPTDEHARLVDNLASGDADACIRLMRDHLELDESRLSFPEAAAARLHDLSEALRATIVGTAA
jgi:DNA-binding GntR family transcriptional regulator